MSRRPLTHAEALTHPWWGQPCAACKAEAVEPCKSRGAGGESKFGGPFEFIHGMRSIGDVLSWVDPRDSEPPIPAHQDCPACPSCAAPCGTASETRAPMLSCCSCGHRWTGSSAE